MLRTVKLSVWLASLVGPVLRLVRTLLMVTAPAFSAERSRLVGIVTLGAWLTGEIVNLKLFVTALTNPLGMPLVVQAFTFIALTWTQASPAILVAGLATMVKTTALVPSKRLVCVPVTLPVTDTLSRLELVVVA